MKEDLKNNKNIDGWLPYIGFHHAIGKEVLSMHYGSVDSVGNFTDDGVYGTP
jgi:hypothetical protein